MIINTGNDAVHDVGELKMSKTSKIQSTRCMGTIYQIKAELIAAAAVSIFGIILLPTAMETSPSMKRSKMSKMRSRRQSRELWEIFTIIDNSFRLRNFLIAAAIKSAFGFFGGSCYQFPNTEF